MKHPSRALSPHLVRYILLFRPIQLLTAAKIRNHWRKFKIFPKFIGNVSKAVIYIFDEILRVSLSFTRIFHPSLRCSATIYLWDRLTVPHPEWYILLYTGRIYVVVGSSVLISGPTIVTFDDALPTIPNGVTIGIRSL